MASFRAKERCDHPNPQPSEDVEIGWWPNALEAQKETLKIHAAEKAPPERLLFGDPVDFGNSAECKEAPRCLAHSKEARLRETNWGRSRPPPYLHTRGIGRRIPRMVRKKAKGSAKAARLKGESSMSQKGDV